MKQVQDDEGVRKLLREFGAQVVEIRPLEIRTGNEGIVEDNQ